MFRCSGLDDDRGIPGDVPSGEWCDARSMEMSTIGAATRVAVPGDQEFEAATQVFNLAAPAQPVAAVTARTVHQVRAAVRNARPHRMPVRVHTTRPAPAAGRATPAA